MITELEEKICNFVKEACYEYFEKKNSNFIMKNAISFNMPVVGLAGCDWDNEFKIVNDYQHITKLTDTSYMVISDVSLKDEAELESNCFGDYVEITFSCTLRKDGSLGFGSVHLSSKGSTKTAIENVCKNDYSRTVLNYLFDVIFEYDNVTNTFTYDSEKHRKLFQVDTFFVSMDQWFWHMCTECVHPEDTEVMDIFRSNDIIKHIRNNDCVIESEIRIKNKEKGYIWIKMVVVFVPTKSRDSLERVFVMFKDVDDRKRKELDYISRAQRDLLTDVYNRDYATSLVTEYLMSSEMNYGAYVLINIDGFRNINDNFGHMTGDDVLVRVANIIKKFIADDDIVGRMSSDEFMVFFKQCGDKQVAMQRVARLMNELDFDFMEDENQVKVSCTSGIVFTYESGTDTDNLFALAGNKLMSEKNMKKQNSYEK